MPDYLQMVAQLLLMQKQYFSELYISKQIKPTGYLDAQYVRYRNSSLLEYHAARICFGGGCCLHLQPIPKIGVGDMFCG
jgi:hypothetical protein